MAALGLREAAQQVGLHRSSLFRAIRAGRLSAERTEGGDYLIDPAELFRVYPPRPERAQQSAQVCPEQGAQPAETDVEVSPNVGDDGRGQAATSGACRLTTSTPSVKVTPRITFGKWW